MQTYYHQETNTYFGKYNPFTLHDVQYPANWFELASPAEIAALGLVEVITVGTREDDRYFWVSEELAGATRTIVNTPKDPEQVKQMKNDAVLAQIAALEAAQLLPRLVRDMLFMQYAQLAQGMGVTLDQVYAMASQPNPPTAAVTYKKLKDFDTQIANLRSSVQ
jgi:hypothetical protein